MELKTSKFKVKDEVVINGEKAKIVAKEWGLNRNSFVAKAVADWVFKVCTETGKVLEVTEQELVKNGN